MGVGWGERGVRGRAEERWGRGGLSVGAQGVNQTKGQWPEGKGKNAGKDHMYLYRRKWGAPSEPPPPPPPPHTHKPLPQPMPLSPPQREELISGVGGQQTHRGSVALVKGRDGLHRFARGASFGGNTVPQRNTAHFTREGRVAGRSQGPLSGRTTIPAREKPEQGAGGHPRKGGAQG